MRDGIVWGDVLGCVFLWADVFLRGGRVFVCICVCVLQVERHIQIYLHMYVYTAYTIHTHHPAAERGLFTLRALKEPPTTL